ncbi:hypothetical protein ACFOSC_31600 [Streptantibioticus rubrisoli]|uniref:Uncharacterized protein n=1 Tax=Streptantibioticus rubrisoli TaxID=1387313 RepID=A0ABT1P9A2_9ACTN|nr:hypothetical protein [Streptantibioticus rubrisoli]MCQ4041939.1 hypothetical protein [Streptantibioticus rubrisoli]
MPPQFGRAVLQLLVVQGQFELICLGADRGGILSDVGLVIVPVRENRSFDHYFGALEDDRGFGAPPLSQIADRTASMR